ncbi:TonB family protein [Hymenobacter sp. HMF4947]|uniref:TonB family protein n=1 Tax=Hymenobacter ginkgonis TaxID=2682976 RepID=A0A7K1TBR9_9BACT|nr:energy transducer TonB [Hymenobacter ginkgonis]MVN75858.1 TonB family protein [Hymenobacter ginkgonis]
MSLFPASLDDVVFEGRNQAYGAYALRQAYRQHLASAGGITVALCATLLLAWGIWQRLAPTVVPVIAPLHPAELALEKFTVETPKQAVITPPPARRMATHVAATIPTEVTKDNTPTPLPKPQLTTPEIDGPAGPAVTNPADGLAEVGPTTGPTTSDNDGDATSAVTGPYIVVEKMPEFAGGQAALLRYLQKNLRYPATALAAQAEGRVFLSFVVQADGTIADVTILKGLGYGLDEEAQRVVRQMPAWMPGYQSKHAVPVRFTLPITFKVQ